MIDKLATVALNENLKISIQYLYTHFSYHKSKLTHKCVDRLSFDRFTPQFLKREIFTFLQVKSSQIILTLYTIQVSSRTASIL